MIINKEHLDVIYEVLADKINRDDIVSAYLEKYSIATNFQYIGEKKSFSTLYYTGMDKSVKLIELSDISCESEVLDRVIEDAQYLIEKAREDRQVLEFYLAKVRSL